MKTLKIERKNSTYVSKRKNEKFLQPSWNSPLDGGFLAAPEVPDVSDV